MTNLDKRDRYDYYDDPSPNLPPYRQGLSYAGSETLQRDNYEEYGEDGEEYDYPARAEEGLRIPTIHRVDSGKENAFNDGLLSPRRLVEQVGAFSSMCDAGAGWGSALVHALQGHKMTEEQAAICIQSHWRRHEAVISGMARSLAAEHIQHALRERMWIREERAAAREQAVARGRDRRTANAEERAATYINAIWRGHLGRARVAQLRKAKSKGSILRSLSFGKKRRLDKPQATSSSITPSQNAPYTPSHRDAAPVADVHADMHVRSERAPAAGGATPRGESLAKRVRRSLSFDRKNAEKSTASKGGGASHAPSTSATRRTFVIERGSQGLGLELDATNTVVTIKAGGRAEQQGLLCVGDTVLTIDGKSCAGALMQEVMVPGRPVYVVEILRPERGSPVAAKPAGVIRRSLSFDRKNAGSGVRRSFSFDRKKW